MTVRDFMARVDARIFKSRITRAILTFGTNEIEGTFFQQPREVHLPGGEIMGVGLSFECHYVAWIALLQEQDQVSVDDYGTFRFLRELIPGGDESGLTVIELGEIV